MACRYCKARAPLFDRSSSSLTIPKPYCRPRCKDLVLPTFQTSSRVNRWPRGSCSLCSRVRAPVKACFRFSGRRIGTWFRGCAYSLTFWGSIYTASEQPPGLMEVPQDSGQSRSHRPRRKRPSAASAFRAVAALARVCEYSSANPPVVLIQSGHRRQAGQVNMSAAIGDISWMWCNPHDRSSAEVDFGRSVR